MPEDKMQQQRFELKYRFTEDLVGPIRDFISCSGLILDEYGETQPNNSYPVHSLYLDSPDLKTYWDTINGKKNRYKLRVRYYENRPDAPVYFEIKRRMNNIIAKQRGGVRRESVADVLNGQIPTPSQMVSRDEKHYVAMQRFIQLMCEIQARPMVHIAYLREAWISERNNSVRVTMDRQVKCEPDPLGRLKTDTTDALDVTAKNEVILELKFTDRHPSWFCDLVAAFGLMQCGAAKYAEGIALVGVEQAARCFDYDGLATPSSAINRLKPNRTSLA